MNERLKVLLDEFKNRRIVHNYADFASQMGKPRSIISELLNGKRTISELFVHEMTTKFPQVNADWLLFGTGSMLKDSTHGANPVEEMPRLEADHIPQLSNTEILLRDMLAEERARNEALNEIIWELKEENGKLKALMSAEHKGGLATTADFSSVADVG